MKRFPFPKTIGLVTVFALTVLPWISADGLTFGLPVAAACSPGTVAEVRTAGAGPFTMEPPGNADPNWTVMQSPRRVRGPGLEHARTPGPRVGGSRRLRQLDQRGLPRFSTSSGGNPGALLNERSACFEEALRADPPRALRGAFDVVRACGEQGPVALVSNGARRDVHATAGALGLAGSFRLILTAENVLQPKPDRFPYEETARRLEVEAAELLVFEDSPGGVEATLAAGCRVVAVPNVRTTRPDAVGHAHAVLESLEDALPLHRLLERLPPK